MIQWVRDIDSEDKLRIYQTIDNLCFVEPDFSGGFSDIYIVGNYAIKKTVYNPIDDVIDHPDAGVDDSGDPIECIVQSDKYLLNQIPKTVTAAKPTLISLYAFTKPIPQSNE